MYTRAKKIMILVVLYCFTCVNQHVQAVERNMGLDRKRPDSINISSGELLKIIEGKTMQWIEVNGHEGERLKDDMDNSIEIERKTKINISKWIIKNYNERKDVIRIYTQKKRRKELALVYVIILEKLVIPMEQNLPSNRQIKQINKFNRLFGDYFHVNENMEILPEDSTYSFDNFYKVVKDTNWNVKFDQNLDDNPMLKQHFPNVISMNLKFEEGGLIYECSQSVQKKKNELFMFDTIKKINQFVRKNYADTIQKIHEQHRKLKIHDKDLEERKMDSIFQRMQSVINDKINELIKSKAYQNERDPNGYNLKTLAQYIQENIERYNIQHIYFFAHGYNVPHGLAQIQGNRLLTEIHDLHKESENILFIRIFWKGGDKKKLQVKTKNENRHVILQKIVYKNVFSIRNASGFRKKTEEAIRCGHSLRRLLTLLEFNNNGNRTFHLISHSLGAALLSHCLINDILAIRYKPKSLIKITKEANYVLDSAWMLKVNNLIYSKKAFDFLYSGRKKTAREFITFMETNNLPNLKIRVFMNAAAIPGVQLFQFSDLCKKYDFIVGYNPYDPTLAKRFVAKGTLISGKLSGTAGKTTLGLNYKNEVGQTEFLFMRNKKEGQTIDFKGYRTSNFFEHDLFFYTQHPLFINTLKVFTKSLE